MKTVDITPLVVVLVFCAGGAIGHTSWNMFKMGSPESAWIGGVIGAFAFAIAVCVVIVLRLVLKRSK